MKRRFTIEIKRYLINRVIDETAAERLTPHNVHQRLGIEKLEVMGIDVPDKPETHREQEIAQVFSFRLKASSDLAVTLKMIKAQQRKFSLAGSHAWTSIYVTTRFGRLFRRMPSCCQTIFLFVAVSVRRLAGTVNRFKWLTGVVSFVTLSVKVSQSGVIDKVWIGISALVGLAVVSLLSLWR
jgi:hypothetical protein